MREAKLILPTKHIPPQRALLTLGAEVLKTLERPRTASALWDSLRGRNEIALHGRISYDWFVLALDLLFLMKAIEYRNGALHKSRP
jgi:hypothetical protein